MSNSWSGAEKKYSNPWNSVKRPGKPSGSSTTTPSNSSSNSSSTSSTSSSGAFSGSKNAPTPGIISAINAKGPITPNAPVSNNAVVQSFSAPTATQTLTSSRTNGGGGRRNYTPANYTPVDANTVASQSSNVTVQTPAPSTNVPMNGMVAELRDRGVIEPRNAFIRDEPRFTPAYGYSTPDGYVYYSYQATPKKEREYSDTRWGKGAKDYDNVSLRLGKKADLYEQKRRDAVSRAQELRYATQGGLYAYGAIATGGLSEVSSSGERFVKAAATGALWEGAGLLAAKNAATKVMYKVAGPVLGVAYAYDVTKKSGEAVKAERTGAARLNAVGHVGGGSAVDLVGFKVGSGGVEAATGQRTISLPDRDVSVNVLNFKTKEPVFEQVKYDTTNTMYAVGGVPAKTRAGRMTKAEQRKQTFNQQYDPRITEFQEFGIIRVRNPQLKAEFVKERRVYVDPAGVVKGIQDVGFRTDLPSLKASGTPSNKVRYTRSQLLSGVGKPLKLGDNEYIISQFTNGVRPMPKPATPKVRVEQVRGFTGDASWIQSLNRPVVVRDASFTTITKGEAATVPGKAITRGGPYSGRFEEPTLYKYRVGGDEFKVTDPAGGAEMASGRRIPSAPIGSPAARRAASMERLRWLAEQQRNKVRYNVPSVNNPGPRDVSTFNPGDRGVDSFVRGERGVGAGRRAGRPSKFDAERGLSPASDIGRDLASNREYRPGFATDRMLSQRSRAAFAYALRPAQSTRFDLRTTSLPDSKPRIVSETTAPVPIGPTPINPVQEPPKTIEPTPRISEPARPIKPDFGRPTPEIVIPIIPPFPGLPRGGGSSSWDVPGGRKGERRYTPSLYAIGGNIRGKAGSTVTGLGVRPLPPLPSSRKKKRGGM